MHPAKVVSITATVKGPRADTTGSFFYVRPRSLFDVLDFLRDAKEYLQSEVRTHVVVKMEDAQGVSEEYVLRSPDHQDAPTGFAGLDTLRIAALRGLSV